MKINIATIVKTGYVISWSVLLLLSAVLSTPLRRRRQSPAHYVIETLVVVDDVMASRFQRWMMDASDGQRFNSTQDVSHKIREYVSLVFHQANARLGTLQHRLDLVISLRIVDVLIGLNILDDIEKDFVDEVSSSKAPEKFQMWIQSKGYGNRYDHSVLFTGHNLSSDYSASGEVTKGRSYTGLMCNEAGYSTSIVQDVGGFQSVYTLVHEIGHSLGAGHDGIACPDDHYIMTANIGVGETPENREHPWYFSTCSADAINDFVSQTSAPLAFDKSSITRLDCLMSQSGKSIPEFNATLLTVSGQLYDADTQCQMLHGKESRACYGNTYPGVDEVCTTLYCLDPTRVDMTRCVVYYAAEGTTCGNKKWCSLGRCVESERAPSIDTECPNGDSLALVKGDYCSSAIVKNPALCYDEAVKTVHCCKSCQQIRQLSQVCPYGDKQRHCNKELCFLSTDYDNSCCGTCAKQQTQSCADVTDIDDMTCEMRVKTDGRQGCYNHTVATSCCRTCSGYETDITDCKYGDYHTDGRCSLTQQDLNACSNTSVKADCCGTCNSGGSKARWTSLPLHLIILAFAFSKAAAFCI